MTKNYGCENCGEEFFTIEGSIYHQITVEGKDWKEIIKGWKVILPRLVISKIIKWLIFGVANLIYYISYPLKELHFFIKDVFGF